MVGLGLHSGSTAKPTPANEGKTMETEVVWLWGFGCIVAVTWLIFSEEGL